MFDNVLDLISSRGLRRIFNPALLGEETFKMLNPAQVFEPLIFIEAFFQIICRVAMIVR